MLALAASDLDAESDLPSFDLVQSAIVHRVLAIRSLNRALSKGPSTVEEGNALFAPCSILVCQSTLIPEGLAEYLTFVRGCIFVPLQMSCMGNRFLFQNLIIDDEIEKARPYLQDMPPIDYKLVGAACASLEALGPLCERESEKKMREGVQGIVSKFYTSSCDAYLAWLKGSVAFLYLMNHAEFLRLIDPTNLAGRLLLSHSVAVQNLIFPISSDQRSARKAMQFARGMLGWLEVLHSDMEPKMRFYSAWPLKRANEV